MFACTAFIKHHDRGNRVCEAEDMDIDTFLSGGFEAFTEANAFTRRRVGAITPVEETNADEMNSNTPRIGHRRQRHMQEAGSDPEHALGRVNASPVEHELKSHKAQLEALKTADPAFFQYLKEIDKSLLEFSDDDGDNEDPDDVSGASPTTGEDDLSHDAITASDHGSDNPCPSGVHLK